MAQLQFALGVLEVIGEFGFIAHDARETDEQFDSNAGYLQVAYPCGNRTPYTRFD